MNMSSAAQVLANRQNGALSTGPKSAAGKEVSSRNATRHGLSGIFTPLLHENTEEFEQIAARVRAEFSPEGENEIFLTGQMIQARCRMHRIQRLEDQTYEQILTEPGADADPDARILAAMGQSGNILDKLERYRAAAERSYYRALRELQSSRKHTQKADATALDNYIKKVIYAPLPDEVESKAFHAAVKLQNEPNLTKPPAAAPAKPSLRSQMPENLALCL
jgi:hypothetical protein